MSTKVLRFFAASVVAIGLVFIGQSLSAQTGAPPTEPAQEMSEEELRLRIELLKRSLGFGGIFGPALQDWMNAPPAPQPGPSGSSDPDNCSRYTEYAARQACGSGDLWGADRIEDGRASAEERAWYDR